MGLTHLGGGFDAEDGPVPLGEEPVDGLPFIFPADENHGLCHGQIPPYSGHLSVSQLQASSRASASRDRSLTVALNPSSES